MISPQPWEEIRRWDLQNASVFGYQTYTCRPNHHVKGNCISLPHRERCHQHPTDSVFPKHFTPHPPPHPQRAARDSTPAHLKQGNPYPFPHLPLMPPGILQTTSAAGFPPFHLIHLRSRQLTSVRAPSSQVLKPSASFLSGLTGHRKALCNRPSLRDLK